ncbi:MAG: hypothetical protein ABSB18_03795 [Candidatus Omnitrophota bacterium]
MKKGKLNSVLSGVAGEYLVAGELSRRGYLASITLRNTRGVDILATNEKATRTAALQVKTRYSKGTAWVLNEKAEKYHAQNLFYAFVSLNFGKPADFYIVPSLAVAKTIKKHNRKWLKTLGRKGQRHNQTSMRTFRDDEQKFLNRWDLLGL